MSAGDYRMPPARSATCTSKPQIFENFLIGMGSCDGSIHRCKPANVTSHVSLYRSNRFTEFVRRAAAGKSDFFKFSFRLFTSVRGNEGL